MDEKLQRHLNHLEVVKNTAREVYAVKNNDLLRARIEFESINAEYKVCMKLIEDVAGLQEIYGDDDIKELREMGRYLINANKEAKRVFDLAQAAFDGSPYVKAHLNQIKADNEAILAKDYSEFREGLTKQAKDQLYDRGAVVNKVTVRASLVGRIETFILDKGFVPMNGDKRLNEFAVQLADQWDTVRAGVLPKKHQ